MQKNVVATGLALVVLCASAQISAASLTAKPQSKPGWSKNQKLAIGAGAVLAGATVYSVVTRKKKGRSLGSAADVNAVKGDKDKGCDKADCKDAGCPTKQVHFHVPAASASSSLSSAPAASASVSSPAASVSTPRLAETPSKEEQDLRAMFPSIDLTCAANRVAVATLLETLSSNKHKKACEEAQARLDARVKTVEERQLDGLAQFARATVREEAKR